MKKMEVLLERFGIMAILRKQKFLLERFSLQPYMWDNPIRIKSNNNSLRNYKN
jgi:hypothetical protein